MDITLLVSLLMPYLPFLLGVGQTSDGKGFSKEIVRHQTLKQSEFVSKQE